MGVGRGRRGKLDVCPLSDLNRKKIGIEKRGKSSNINTEYLEHLKMFFCP
jgi:hypothetical protein